MLTEIQNKIMEITKRRIQRVLSLLRGNTEKEVKVYWGFRDEPSPSQLADRELYDVVL